MNDNCTEILEVPDKFQLRAHVLCHALYMCSFIHKKFGYFSKKMCIPGQFGKVSAVYIVLIVQS